MLGEEGFALIGEFPLVNTADGATAHPTAIWILFQEIDSAEVRMYSEADNPLRQFKMCGSA